MRISTSQLRKYLECPRSFKLSEIDCIAPEYKSLSYCKSTTVKESISFLHNQPKKICDFGKQEIHDACEKIWKAVIDDENVKKDELETIVVQAKKATKSKPATSAITKSERMLSNIQKWVFDYSRKEIDAKILYTSVYFETVIGDCTFVGYIDMIREVNGVLEIIIFNSSQQSPSMEYHKRDFINSLFVHAVLFGKIFANSSDLKAFVELKMLPKIYIYHLPSITGDSKQHIWDVSRTKEQLLQFEYELLYAVSGIQNEFFPMFPHSICRCCLCPYQKACKEMSVFAENVSFETPQLAEPKEQELV